MDGAIRDRDPQNIGDIQDSTMMDEARARMDESAQFWNPIYDNALQQVRFVNGDQWEKKDLEKRKKKGRPTLVINKVGRFVRSVANRYIGNEFKAGLTLRSSKANEIVGETGMSITQVAQKLMAQIQEGAANHYNREFGWSCKGGVGWIHVVPQTDMMGDRAIRIVSINRLYTVYVDPKALEPDYSDADYGFIVSYMSEKSVKEKWPGYNEINVGDEYEDGRFHSENIAGYIGMPEFGGMANMVAIMDYYSREKVEMCLYQTPSGILYRYTKEETQKDKFKPAAETVNIRDYIGYQIHWTRMAENVILEKSIVTKDCTVPLSPMLGEELDTEDGIRYAGVAYHMMDSQREVNYIRSSIAERMSSQLGPKIAMGSSQIPENYDDLLPERFRGNNDFLIYADSKQNGQPPSVVDLSQASPHAHQFVQIATNELNQESGITPEALGEQTNARSGLAIRSRAESSARSQSQYEMNLKMCIRRVAQIILDQMGGVYAGTLSLGGETAINLPQGWANFNASDFDIAPSLSANIETERDIARETVGALMQSSESAKQILMPIAMELMDNLPDREVNIARSLAMLPPHLRTKKDNARIVDALGEQPPDPQQQLELAQKEADVDETVSKTELNRAKAVDSSGKDV